MLIKSINNQTGLPLELVYDPHTGTLYVQLERDPVVVPGEEILRVGPGETVRA